MRQIDPNKRIWKHAGWIIKPHPEHPNRRNSWHEADWIVVPPIDFPINFKIDGFDKYGGIPVTGLKWARFKIERFNELAKQYHPNYKTTA